MRVPLRSETARHYVKALRSLPEKALVRNTAALYAVQFCRKLLPLVSVPFLARILGPAGWGRVAFVQAFGDLMVVLIEFGFNLSATRDVARERDNPDTCRDVVSGVLGAQVVLAAAAVFAAVVAAIVVPDLRNDPKLLASGILYGLAQGLMPLWFYQGLERMGIVAALEISGKLAGLAGLLLFVRSPQDGWKVLLLQALPPALCAVAGFLLARKFIAFRMPTRALVVDAIRRGWPMFLFRSGIGLCAMANTLVLGLCAPPVIVGYYAAADKISRAVSGLLTPIREALYPRLSHLVRRSEADAARLAWPIAIVTVIGGLFLGLGLYVFAPKLLTILMGPQFAPAVPVLRVLATLPLVLAITESVGLQWLLPRGKDGVVNQAFLTVGVLNLLLAAILAPRYAHIGMAWAVAFSQAVLATALVWSVVRLTRNKLVVEACAAGD